jgi:hypothetical protein
MKHLKLYLPITVGLLLFLSLFAFYKKTLHTNKKTLQSMRVIAESVEDLRIADSSGCDPGIWKHVYNPARLKVINNCITVMGVITESYAETDGDQHMLLKPDSGLENLLNKKNIKSKKGNLVIEAVCINNITEKKVGDACKGYINHITIPSVGAHVKVSGSLVLDTHNGWNEIHPVSKIVNQ